MMPTPRLLLALGLFIILIHSTAVAQDTGCKFFLDQQNSPDYENEGNCPDGYDPCPHDKKRCCDTNECQKGKTKCGNHATCKNVCGNYTCECVTGFSFNNKSGNCQDVDECVEKNDCDPTTKCENSPGSYRCTCQTGYFKYNDVVRGGKDATKCKAINIPAPSNNNCSDGEISLCNFATELRHLYISSLSMQTSADVKIVLKNLLALLDGLVSQMKTASKVERHNTATEMMKAAEDFLRVLAFALPSGLSSVSSETTELAMYIRGAGSQNQSSAQLVQSETQMELKWEAARKEGEAFTLAGLLTYQGMEHMMSDARVEGEEWEQVGKSPEWLQEVGKPNYKVLSRVAAAFVGHNETKLLNSPVTVSFNHQKPDSKPAMKVICAFWKPVNGSGHWSEEGCTRLSSTGTQTVCQCTHMTSFAVLMAFYDIEDRGLDVITKVGLVVSLICLFLSILTFLFCRVIRGIRTTIHLHLCLALFTADVIFLLGAGNPSNMIACAIVAGFLHYSFLSVFCWMLLEGVELYLMVVQVFKTHSLKHWHIFLVGYGLPAVLVGISAAINSKGYGNKNCWLTRDGGFLWSFLGPVSLIIMVNAIVFVVTVWRLSEKFADINPNMGKLKKERVLTITAIAQLCILGTTWIFGMFQFSDHTLVMSYIFTILNSLQGLFIFLLHCLLKKQIRDEYYRWFCKLNKGHSSDNYSDMSSTAGSNTLRAQKSSRESGM
ncbi:adhesion G protein-coupled receptor E5 isoform X3 [Anolis sagrei]|uniref:adhesion G protein-coupled receptor E5 isoform X3 n=1 Tax=Anolis sagrei TaxID=38937 RepID=UPI0035213999